MAGLALLVLHQCEAADKAQARIAYVTNAWFPKVDGAAISVMEHVRYFASQGHPVLVVKPAYAANSPLSLAAAGAADPLPSSALLSYLEFRTAGRRGGGYEPSMDALDFPQIERALMLWRPDVLLVADPDLFLFDAFRLPGFNAMMRSVNEPPVTIACFTSFAVDAALAMPEFWWMHNAPLRALFEQGLATAYASFDHIFVNAQPSFDYLKPLAALFPIWDWRHFAERVRVVASRGVQIEFCNSSALDQCTNLPAVHAMGTIGAHELSFVYIGRLSYDKSVDDLLKAFRKVRAQARALPCCECMIRLCMHGIVH